jgi:hypothetical protein
MQEFLNPNFISEIDYEINMDIFNEIKNTNDDIYIICSKNNKKVYDLIIKKIEDKLYKIGLNIKKYFFISETFYNQDLDDIKSKKIKLLLESSIGNKINNDLFDDIEVESYDQIFYYDEDIDMEISKYLNDFLKKYIDNSRDTIKERIINLLNDDNKIIFLNYVSPNKLNRIQSIKVKLKYNKLIKKFENFRY